MYYKLAFKISLLISAVIILSFLTLVYVYDPLQIYHKPWFREVSFNQNMREQDYGVIKNYDFDSAIFGTSMLENTSAKEASKVLGGNFVNISVAGGTYFERGTILKKLLKEKAMKRVILSLDIVSSDMPVQMKTFNEYLYDDNSANVIKVYLNKKYLKCILTFSQHKDCIGAATSLDRPTMWEQNSAQLFGGFDNWLKEPRDGQVVLELEKITKAHNILKNKEIVEDKTDLHYLMHYVDKNLLQIMKEYPNVQFDIIIPPYSLLGLALQYQTKDYRFDEYMNVIEFMAENSSKMKNVNLYWFYNDTFVGQIENYKDLYHYNSKINSMQLERIKENKNILNRRNVERRTAELKRRLRNINISYYAQKILNYDESKK